MEYKKLGRSGLYVSRLVLGTMNFGSSISEKQALEIMDAAVDAGINCFDTANNYGKTVKKEGVSEEIVGKWISNHNKRDKVILSTKVYEPMGTLGANDKPGLSAYKIRNHFKDSLKRLQTDYIDIYYMHHIDKTYPWDEVFPVFQNMIANGSIIYLASSNFAGWNIADVQAEAKKRNMFGLICEQHKYNLMNRLPELEVLPSAGNHGLGVMAWSPLNGGKLSRNYKFADMDDLLIRNQLTDFKNLCYDLGEKEDTVALAWLLHNPYISAPIIGPRSAEQIYDAAKALELKLSEDTLSRLNEIFPGPGGEAPEAYAW
ncbi:MAG: aldo/keto reductase [Lachnospiraceae bacterium]|nr:aldo/keto reductase [Lachnospiraceae bacterium]